MPLTTAADHHRMLLELLLVATVANEELLRVADRDGLDDLRAELVPVQSHLREATQVIERRLAQ